MLNYSCKSPLCVDIDNICTDIRKGRDCKFSQLYKKHYFLGYLEMLEEFEQPWKKTDCVITDGLFQK